MRVGARVDLLEVRESYWVECLPDLDMSVWGVTMFHPEKLGLSNRTHLIASHVRSSKGPCSNSSTSRQ